MRYRLLLFVVIGTACSQKGQLTEEYIAELTVWKTERMAELEADDGYLSLVGLFWLEEGESTYGSDNSNTIVFPSEANPQMGTIILSGDSVIHRSPDGAEELMNPPDTESYPNYTHKTLTWYVIKRGGAYGIRIRNTNSETLSSFEGVSYYPPNPELNVVATFVPFDPPKKIPIENIVGFTISTESPGHLLFEIDGRQHSLDVLKDGETYFIIFGDPSNGKDTYGGGRYMHTDFPDENNEVVLDFNKSYNPPCAFTEFATCPLPPAQNVLKVKIFAGELNYGEH